MPPPAAAGPIMEQARLPLPTDPPVPPPLRAPRPRREGPRGAAGGRAPRRGVPAGFFRDLVGSLRNGVLAITRDGALAFINDEAYRTLGLKPGAGNIGRHFAEALGACPDVVRVLNDAFSLSHLPNRAELRLKPSGKVIGYTLCRVIDGAGAVQGTAMLFKDLTRVEQLEERERLRDRLAALGEMAAAIAHEVKNPLAGIEVMAGLLRRRLPASVDAQEMLAEIIQEAKVANAIVLEVLEFVRPVQLQVEPVSLQEVIDRAVQMAASQVPRGQVGLDLALPAGVPAIEGDEHQLTQLFTNLFTNALEALGGRGRIAVTAAVQGTDANPHGEDAQDPAAVTIEVTDDGPGVPAEIRDRIFAPFFTTKPRGSGLGLAIVRKLVEAHEGAIDVMVGDRGGTTFRVTLPVAHTPEPGGSQRAA
jgi:signal transduction histidine kinase